MQISGNQMVSARGLLRWNHRHLSSHTSVAYSMISVYERGLRPPVKRLEEIIKVFQDAGIEFINADGIEGVILHRNGRG